MADKEFDFEEFYKKQMLNSADDDIKYTVHTLWSIYCAAIGEGFTKVQAMDILKTYIASSFPPKTVNR